MKRKVLLVIPDYGIGGAQRVFSDQSKFLSSHFDVSLCTFNSESVDMYGSVGTKIDLNVKAGKNVFTKAYFFLLRIIRLRKIKSDFDFCISHLEGADYINILSRRKEKVICCIHGTKFHDGEIKGWLGSLRKNLLMPYLYKRAHVIVTVSSAIRTELILKLKIPEHKIVTINNGFDIKAIIKKAEEGIPTEIGSLMANHSTICLCSRLAPQKNQQAFIPIFAEVTQSIKCKLIIIGDGELRDELVNQCKSLRLSVFAAWADQKFSPLFDVYFLGNQLNPFSYLSKASLFVLPSAWEGFPLALCEAMCCSVPVIAADCPTGPREILKADDEDFKSDYGMLLPIPSTEKNQVFYSWANAILKMLNNKEMSFRYVQNARTRVEDFSMEKMESAWLSTIQSIS
jgi:glycosyltransferase involved in cell wall biosynthesis